VKVDTIGPVPRNEMADGTNRNEQLSNVPVDGTVSAATLERWRRGVKLNGRPNHTWFTIILREYE
jgi:hypothetical protein